MTLAKTFKRAMATMVALGSCWVGSSWAVPVVWTDSVGGLGRLITPDNPYTYSHNITGGSNGYTPGVDSIISASLYIWLYDDAFFGDIPWIGDEQETVGFKFDNGTWHSENVDSLFYSLDNFDFTVTSLVTDGFLNVTVKSYRGDFGFAGSKLVAAGEERSTTPPTGATPVPEPTTLALFGIGLLGIGLASRARQRKAESK